MTSIALAIFTVSVGCNNMHFNPSDSCANQETEGAVLSEPIVPVEKPAKRSLLADRFDSRKLAETINYFVERGELASAQELAVLSKQSTTCMIRAGLVCRILWQNADSPIRPSFHCVYLNFEFEKSKLETWPLYPLAKSNETYFVLDEEYLGCSEMEQVEDYIKHCQQEGEFLRTPVSVPTSAQALDDAKDLIGSNRWSEEFSGSKDKSSARCVTRPADVIVDVAR